MEYSEHKEIIKNASVPESLKYCQIFYWLHPATMPLGLYSIGETSSQIVKVAEFVKNRYGNVVPVIAVEKNAFSDNKTVTDIILPSSVMLIEEGAFARCTALKNITLPKAVKEIKVGTFAGCDNLENVYYEGTEEDWKKIKFAQDITAKIHFNCEFEKGDKESAESETGEKDITNLLRNTRIYTFAIINGSKTANEVINSKNYPFVAENVNIEEKVPYCKTNKDNFMIYNIDLTAAKEICKAAGQQNFVFVKNERKGGKFVFEFWTNSAKKNVDSKQSILYKKLAENELFYGTGPEQSECYAGIAKKFKISVPFDKIFPCELRELVKVEDAALGFKNQSN